MNNIIYYIFRNSNGSAPLIINGNNNPDQIFFENENYSNQDLRNSRFTQTGFENCNFTDALLTSSIFNNVTALSQTTFESAQLNSCTFRNINFTRAKLENANMNNSTITNSGITDCNLKFLGAEDLEIDDTDLTDCDFSGSTITANDWVNNCTFTRCTFNNSTISECDIAEITISDSNFLKTELMGNTFVRTTLNSDDFSNSVIIANRFLQNTDLNNATFKKAVLQNCEFSNSLLNNCNFRRAVLINNNFTRMRIDSLDIRGCSIRNGNIIDPREITNVIYDQYTELGPFEQFMNEGVLEYIPLNILETLIGTTQYYRNYRNILPTTGTAVNYINVNIDRNEPVTEIVFNNEITVSDYMSEPKNQALLDFEAETMNTSGPLIITVDNDNTVVNIDCIFIDQLISKLQNVFEYMYECTGPPSLDNPNDRETRLVEFNEQGEFVRVREVYANEIEPYILLPLLTGSILVSLNSFVYVIGKHLDGNVIDKFAFVVKPAERQFTHTVSFQNSFGPYTPYTEVGTKHCQEGSGQNVYDIFQTVINFT